MNRIFLSLGSNIDKEVNYPAGLHLLQQTCHVIAISTTYETVPVGLLDQANFYNGAVLVESELDPAGFKQQIIIPIEQQLNRTRQADKNAPRTIDIDIILFNDHVLDYDQKHHIPDPDLLKFPHIAVPIAELAPHMPHPETGEPLQSLADRLMQKLGTPSPIWPI